MAESLLLAAAADLRHRVDCCRRGTPDGYGEKASLRNVYRAACGTYHRYDYPELTQIKQDAATVKVLAELAALKEALREAGTYLDGEPWNFPKPGDGF